MPKTGVETSIPKKMEEVLNSSKIFEIDLINNLINSVL